MNNKTATTSPTDIHNGNIAKTSPQHIIGDTDMTATVTTNATAFVTKGADDKFICTFNGAILGSSKHADYFEYHLRRKDVKVLNEAGIQFITYLDEQGAEVKTVDVTAKPVRAKKAAATTDTAAAATDTATAAATDTVVADAGIPLADTSVPVAADAPAADAVASADTPAAV